MAKNHDNKSVNKSSNSKNYGNTISDCKNISECKDVTDSTKELEAGDCMHH